MSIERKTNQRKRKREREGEGGSKQFAAIFIFIQCVNISREIFNWIYLPLAIIIVIVIVKSIIAWIIIKWLVCCFFLSIYKNEQLETKEFNFSIISLIISMVFPTNRYRAKNRQTNGQQREDIARACVCVWESSQEWWKESDCFYEVWLSNGI